MYLLIYIRVNIVVGLIFDTTIRGPYLDSYTRGGTILLIDYSS